MKYVLCSHLAKSTYKMTWRVKTDFQILRLLWVPQQSIVVWGKHGPNSQSRFPALLFPALPPFCASSYPHLHVQALSMSPGNELPCSHSQT